MQGVVAMTWLAERAEVLWVWLAGMLPRPTESVGLAAQQGRQRLSDPLIPVKAAAEASKDPHLSRDTRTFGTRNVAMVMQMGEICPGVSTRLS